MQRFHWNYAKIQIFQTINGLTRPTVFMPNLKQKPKIMSNPWVKSRPRDGETLVSTAHLFHPKKMKNNQKSWTKNYLKTKINIQILRVAKIENSLNIDKTRLWKGSSLTNLVFDNIQGWNPHNIYGNLKIYTKILRIYNGLIMRIT